MNPERTTKSLDMRRTYQLEFRKMIEAERKPRKASDSKSPVKETNRDRLSTHRDMTSANKEEREASADKHETSATRDEKNAEKFMSSVTEWVKSNTEDEAGGKNDNVEVEIADESDA